MAHGLLGQWALWYADEGYDVFPCAVRGKLPIVKDGFLSASSVLATVDEWWTTTPKANIGLPCAPNGLLVLDVDRHVDKATGEVVDGFETLQRLCGGAMPDTPTAHTGGGGTHFVFLLPDWPMRYKAGPGLDIKVNGYIIVAPSVHPSGVIYRWEEGKALGDIKPAPVPDWLEAAIRRTQSAPPVPVQPSSRPPADSTGRLTDTEVALEALKRIPADDYHEWIGVGKALHALRFDLAEWEAWSATSPNYEAGVCEGRWRSFAGSDRPEVATGYLVNLARQTDGGFLREGWRRGTQQRELRDSQPARLVDTDRLRDGAERRGMDLPHVTPGPDFPLHDIGNGRRFCALYGAQFRWVDDWSCWLHWTGCRWERNADLAARRCAKATAESIFAEASAATHDRDKLVKHWLVSCASGRITAMLEMAKADLAITSKDLDTDLWVLNFPNGTVDLRTGNLRPHNPADLITYVCSSDYDAEAHISDSVGAVAWRKFLRDVTNGDDEYAMYMQRAFGYGCVGEPREEILLSCYGEARTGKSTMLETIRVHLGDYSEELAFEDLLKKHGGGSDLTPGLARLQGKRFVASSESSAGRALNEGLVKTLTGGEAITTAAKYERPVTWVPQLLLALASNSRPRIPHDDSGMWRRYREIPFLHQMADPADLSAPPERRADPGLKSLLRLEAGKAVLAWLVDGCLLWQQQGLGTCAAVERSSAECRAEMNPLGGWLADACRVDTERRDWFTTTADLYASYAEWHRHAGERGLPLSLKDFGRAIKGVVKSDRSQRRVEGRAVWGYTGILTADGVPSGDEDDVREYWANR